ncbi:tetratricopeptide repeat protein [Mucilaginibacter phyllosphaerae]
MIKSDEEEIYKEKIDQAWKFYWDDKETEANALCAELRLDFPKKLAYEYIESLIAINNKRYKEAEKYLLNLLDRDEKEAMTGRICYNLSVIYEKKCYESSKAADYVFDQSKSKYHHEKSRRAKDTPENVYHMGYSHYSDGERIPLFQEAIVKFPDEPIFYIYLAQQYRRNENYKHELLVYNDAINKEVVSASLYFNLAWYYYKSKAYSNALTYYQESLKRSVDGENRKWPLYYMMGVCQQHNHKLEDAESSFRQSFVLTAQNSDCWFGFISLLNLYAETGNEAAIKSLLVELLITEETMSEGSLGGGPVWLSPNITDSIYFEPDIASAYKSIKKIKVAGMTELQQGKLWFTRLILAKAVYRETDIHQALKKVISCLGAYGHDYILDELASSHVNKFDESVEKRGKLDPAVKELTKDLDDIYALRALVVPHLETIITTLFKAELFQTIITFVTYFTQQHLEEANLLFELAYSSSKLGDDDNAYKLYLRLFELNPNSSGVCNNLGVIAGKKKDFAQAVDWYKKGLIIDPNDELIKNNLKSSQQRLAEQQEEAKIKKRLEQEQMEAIAQLKKESDFALDKLSTFLANIKKESGFKDGKLAIPKNRFPQLMGAQKQFSDSLRDQWLSKKYLTETGERNEFQVMVYAINPHIESELTRLENYKLPAHWIAGIASMTPEKLEQHHYFNLIEKIRRANKKFSPLLERDYNELVFNALVGNDKATIVLSGSMVELVLTYYFEKKKMATIPVMDKGIPKPKKLYNCVLSDLIDYAESQKLFGNDFPHLSNLSRIYRNYIHPGRELKERLDKTKADLCFISVTEILKRVL